MALFRLEDSRLKRCKPIDFKLEKELQKIIEENLETIFNCKFVASEFSTGSVHSGRIDTLGLSEDGNPVILEYKKIESSELLNQGLYYLNWILDHKGDFQIAVNDALGQSVDVDWSDVRVICIAPGYKKYDLHAARVMGASIELWQYKLFESGLLHIEEIFTRTERQAVMSTATSNTTKNPVMVAAGKKAAITRATSSWTTDHHYDAADTSIHQIIDFLRESIQSIDETVEEAPKKNYIAYRTSQNFVCLNVKKNSIRMFLKIAPSDVDPMPTNGRDVSNIGHVGTGDFELTVSSLEEAEAAMLFVKESFDQVGGG